MASARVARRAGWRAVTASIVLCGFIFLYYWALLSDGRFFYVAPVRYDFIFNSMIEYLSRGRFDVDPDAVLQEGFTRDGRTYAYFGITPALLRWPILLFPSLRLTDFTAIYCAAAATIAAAAKLGAVLRAGRTIGAVPFRRRALLLAMATVVLGGAQVQFLRPSVYQESLFWASAIAAVFVLLAFRWCVDVTGRRRWHTVAMASLAGLCLLTRVSTSIGLYAATAAVLLPELIAAFRRGGMGPAVRVVLVPALVLVLFAALCGVVNYARWGSPLTFQDYRYYNILPAGSPVYDVLIGNGYFNAGRIPFALGYYFVPVWSVLRSDGHLLFRAVQDRLYYTVELPPASFFASDLMLCFLCGIGCMRLARGRSSGLALATSRLIAIGLAIPGLFMLMAIALTFRYRMEFYPCFEFLALFGLMELPRMIAARPRLLTGACVATVVISTVTAHAFLLAYKISPWGDSVVIEKPGWNAGYRQYFRATYPGVYRAMRLGG